MMDVPLKEHIESRIFALEKATSLAANNMERRLEGMNEFRAQLKDQAANFVTRNEFKQLWDDIRELRESRAELAGKASQKSFMLTLIISLLSLIIGLFGLLYAITK